MIIDLIYRFVFRPVLVADGNFKADHVKQVKDDDIWLLDGGGMVPNQEEYSNFLKTALELPTVSYSKLVFHPDPGPGPEAVPPRTRCIPFLIYLYLIFFTEGPM